MESLFTPSWYRIAKLKPRLRGHAQIHRHEYRGELWYVLQDHATGRFYRFTPIAYQIIGLMDGTLTVHELWEHATERFGDDAPTQGEMVQILSQLHLANVLLCDVPPDTEELLSRHEKVEQSKWKLTLRSPLSIRIPLLDPERFLRYTVGIVRPFMSIYGAIVWLTVVGTALILAGMHWPELTENVKDRVLSAENLVVMWIAYPIIKVFHELGHGYAVKTWGGEVHEMGIMLLVFMPVPYVDASSSSAFREKRQRVLVGAAGIMVELFIAALALFLWLNMEEGYLRSIVYNIIFLASMSTVLFNGNPLLRYDGYYVLSDLLEIPNLAQRSLNYLGYVVKRYVLGLKDTKPPYTGPGERFWFIFYAVTSFLYRIVIYAAIILFIAEKFFIVGIILSIWAGMSMFVIPVFKKMGFVLFSPVLREKRVRAIMASGFFILVIMLLLFFIPFPLWTRTEGVVWVSEESLVRAETHGFVRQIKARPNRQVHQGDVLIECYDPLLIANVKVLEAQLGELSARYDASIIEDLVQSSIIQEEIAKTREELARAQERLKALTIVSPCDGLFIVPGADDLPERYVEQGELLAYVLNEDRPTVRVVVQQSDVDLVRHRTEGIEIRLTERLEEIIPAVMKREVPGALEQLPSPTLSTFGGGEIAVDPREEQKLKTLEKLFQFDIELDKPVENLNVGGRVYVRFDHGYEPLAFQWYRSLRQLFLRRFNV